MGRRQRAEVREGGPPLGNLSEEVAALEDHQHLAATIIYLRAEMRAIALDLRGHSVEQEYNIVELREELATVTGELKRKFAPTGSRKVIARCGRRTFKVHSVGIEGVDLLPPLWRTVCGPRLAGWTFTGHFDAEQFPPDALCKKCFVQKPHENVGTRSSSSSSSSWPSQSE